MPPTVVSYPNPNNLSVEHQLIPSTVIHPLLSVSRPFPPHLSFVSSADLEPTNHPTADLAYFVGSSSSSTHHWSRGTTGGIRPQGRHFVDWHGHVCNIRGVNCQPLTDSKDVRWLENIVCRRLLTPFAALSMATTLRSRRSRESNIRWAAVPA